MADVNTFDQARAEAWTTEVEAELAIVNSTLEEVAAECAESPYEDDAVFSAIMGAGRAFGEAWQGLAKQFSDTIENMHTITKSLVNAVSSIVDGVIGFVTGKSY